MSRPVRMTIAVALVLAVPAVAADRVRLTYVDAGYVLDALPDNLPPDLRGRTASDIAGMWAGWVARRDAEVRNRIARGEEDSLVNFWMYGTSFTSEPRATRDDEVLRRRLDDLIEGTARPGANERLQFARRILTRSQLDPASRFDRDRIRRYLVGLRQRMVDEFAAYDRVLAPATLPGDGGVETTTSATVFKERGLSTDTSMLADFGTYQALAAIAGKRLLSAGAVHRVAVVGPGLDFTNKADGYDFYPQQTIQPFALVDSLMRLGLAAPDLRITTFDVNPRVNEHLRGAVAAARAGRAYLLTLPLDETEAWTADLRLFWKTLGARLGAPGSSTPPPASAGPVGVRAVTVRPAVAATLTPTDLNIVFERLAQMTADERFDVIVATNVLVYYDVFEQSLALSNAAAMLKPGGLVITNTAVFPTSPIKPEADYLRVVYSPRQHDHFFWYQRQ